jgi:hypothetical protein
MGTKILPDKYSMRIVTPPFSKMEFENALSSVVSDMESEKVSSRSEEGTVCSS